MIIHSKSDEPFCQRVHYSHETGIISNTAEVNKFMNTFKSGFRTRKCMSAPKLSQLPNNYNHYFINPELRYKHRTVNPKNEKQNLINQDFVYNNLHNEVFNSWRHPFERQPESKQLVKNQLTEEQLGKLVKFKQFVQRDKKGRVPALVNQFLQKKQ